MSLQLVANHLAAHGRGPDTTLVHMSNREVAGLQALAQKHGGQLSVNPDTGLPEAGFLDNILPMVAGAGLTYFSGGAISPLMAGGIIGGITALDSKDLSKGLVAGLGAYGGSGMVGGLAGLGAEAAYMPGAAGEAARAAGTEAAIANGTYQSQVGTGLGNFIDQPMNSLSTLGGGSAIKGSLPILAGLAPAAAEAFDEEDEDKPPEQHKGYIRKYALDPVTGQYKQVGVYEAGGDPNVDVTSKAGTAGAFGAVGQSEYEAAQGMAAGGTATDSERIYDYLMGRGSNPMQFTSASRPRVDYSPYMPKPITPTTPILEDVYDPYGNIQRGGGGGTDSAEKREQREKDYNTIQDYLTIERYNPETGLGEKDPQSLASLAALGAGERAMHMQGVRLQHPIRTFVSDVATKVGLIPIANNIYEHFKYGNLGMPQPPGMPKAPVSDVVGVSTPEFYAKEVEADLKRQQAATEQLRRNIAPSDAAQDVRIAQFDAGRTHEGGGGGQGPTGPQSAASRSSDGPGQSGSGGWGRGAAGGLSTPYGFQHMAHGGISNLHQYNLGSYSDGGRLLKGPGDGVSDSIPATIGRGQPARLADGEFVVPARIVSELGNGSTDAGARELYKMMDRIQAGRKKTVGKDQVAKNSKSARHLPA